MRLPFTIFLEEVPFATICYISWLRCAKTLEGLFAFTLISIISNIFAIGICIICVISSAIALESVISGEVSFLGVCNKVWFIVSFITKTSSDFSVSLKVSNIRATYCVSSKVLTFIILLYFSIMLSYDFSGESVS